jgi:sterol O-acyltransferase
MSSSTDIHANGNGISNHDHILRPRAVKSGNPAVLRTLSEEGLLATSNGKDASANEGTSGQTRYAINFLIIDAANPSSGRSTPVPADAPPSVQSISSARKQLRAEQRRRLFPTIEYASRVSHFDPNSDYRDFQGFYILFWIALTIMAITTMLRNIKDTGYPMRVQIWQLFTVKVWELGIADGLMVASTSISFPLHRLFRSKTGKMFGLRWATGGMAIQSIYQTIWFTFWVL